MTADKLFVWSGSTVCIAAGRSLAPLRVFINVRIILQEIQAQSHFVEFATQVAGESTKDADDNKSDIERLRKKYAVAHDG